MTTDTATNGAAAPSPTKFTDTKGREWKIALDPFLIAKVKTDTGVLLTKWGDDKFALAIKLRSEPWFLCDVLWSLLDEQAAANGCRAAAEQEQRELTREFASGLGNNVLTAALDALEGGIADFFMSQGEAESMRELLRKAGRVTELMGSNLLERVKQLDPEQLVKNYSATASSSQPSPTSQSSPVESHSAN
jgi:hypothetical protein